MQSSRVELLVIEMAGRDAHRILRWRKASVGVICLAIGERAIDPNAYPYESERRHQGGPGARMLRAAGGALGWLLALLAVVGGVGWLYLIRDVHLLDVGPSVSGALPLEELAKRGAQPLLRMLVAWLPAGLAAGFAVALATRLRTML